MRYHFHDYVTLYSKRKLSLGGPDLIRWALERQFSLAGCRRGIRQMWFGLFEEIEQAHSWLPVRGIMAKRLWAVTSAECGPSVTARRKMRTSALQLQWDEFFQWAWKTTLSQDKNHHPWPHLDFSLWWPRQRIQLKSRWTSDLQNSEPINDYGMKSLGLYLYFCAAIKN